MTSIVDIVKDLFTEDEPKKNADQGFPIETEEYWQDTSVGTTVYQPPVNGAEYKPTDDKVLPGYRGIEEHGVPFDATVNYLIPQAPIETQPDKPEEMVAESVLVEPIAVTVVDMPIPVGRESRISTNRILLTFNATLPAPVQIAPKSLKREIVRLCVTGADVVWVSTTPQGAVSNGFPIVAGMGIVTMHSTDPLYAFAPTADSTICVMEEFTVSARESAV